MPDVGAGCGLRQGEIFGLAVDDRGDLGWLYVRQQVKKVPAMVRLSLLIALAVLARPQTARPSTTMEPRRGPGGIYRGGVGMDIVDLMEWLIEQGCCAVFKADGERTPGTRWMVIVSGGALGKDSFFRTDQPSPDACLQDLLDHLETSGISPIA